MEAAFSQFLKQNRRLNRYTFPRKHTKNHMQKSYPSLLLSSLNSQYYSVSWWLCHWGNTKVSIQISCSPESVGWARLFFEYIILSFLLHSKFPINLSFCSNFTSCLCNCAIGNLDVAFHSWRAPLPKAKAVALMTPSLCAAPVHLLPDKWADPWRT